MTDDERREVLDLLLEDEDAEVEVEDAEVEVEDEDAEVEDEDEDFGEPPETWFETWFGPEVGVFTILAGGMMTLGLIAIILAIRIAFCALVGWVVYLGMGLLGLDAVYVPTGTDYTAAFWGGLGVALLSFALQGRE